MPIVRYLQEKVTFETDAITAMTEALERVCGALQIDGQESGREVIATGIIGLARGGVIDAKALGDRVVAVGKAQDAL